MKFKIKRFDGENSRYDIFELEPKPRMSVLEALFQIQEKQDSSLCFRYSCRGAVCGSCAMLINKKQRLACRTQVSEIIGERVINVSNYGAFAKLETNSPNEILIEPLPNFRVIKDLIVDMDPLFNHYKDMKPWLENKEINLEKETTMLPEDLKKIEKYGGCILCGLCYGACPSFARNNNFIGPASLAKAWRFYSDSRNTNIEDILERVDKSNGVWSCDEVYRCVEVCPKEVTPTNAITGFMRKIIIHRFKKIFR